MANRPGSLANLTKKKSVGAQHNFADTFNWVVACVANLRGGAGVKINWPAPDTPQIEIQDGGQNGNSGGGGGGGEPVDPGSITAVSDISEEPITEGKQLNVAYTNGNTKTIVLPYLTEFRGTDSSTTARGSDFTFKSDQYSNIEVKCVGGEIKIGAYYV